jgi:hypothetical protein
MTTANSRAVGDRAAAQAGEERRQTGGEYGKGLASNVGRARDELRQHRYQRLQRVRQTNRYGVFQGRPHAGEGLGLASHGAAVVLLHLLLQGRQNIGSEQLALFGHLAQLGNRLACGLSEQLPDRDAVLGDLVQVLCLELASRDSLRRGQHDPLELFLPYADRTGGVAERGQQRNDLLGLHAYAEQQPARIDEPFQLERGRRGEAGQLREEVLGLLSLSRAGS